jgi:hypothetical protein
MENGDRIRIGANQEFLQIFSPRYRADFIPKNEMEKSKKMFILLEFLWKKCVYN